MPRRTGSSQRWRQRQERDIYVEQATRAGWRSRAVFKLEQIQDRERLLRPGVTCVDLGSAPETLEALRNLVGPKPVDLVMSDMAPNMSGNRTIDQPRSLALLDEAFAFAREVLKPGGDLLFKAFQGEGIDALTRDLKRDFKTVKTLKPKASRPESREIYLLARSFGM